MRHAVLLGALAFLLIGCAAPVEGGVPGRGGGMGMGMRGGMMERHSAPIPEAYAGQTSAVPASEDSLERGASVFATHCATCHGDGGMGDGPSAAALDPSPAPIARTSQVMDDDYLFWRISEGGAPFDTAMPVWKGTLDEGARWDVINYVRALGRGEAAPASGMGGALFDAEAEAAQREAMLAQAIKDRVITDAQAGTFRLVHAALEEYRATHARPAAGDSPAEREAAMLKELVGAGAITQAQADAFANVHDRLVDAGLMQ